MFFKVTFVFAFSVLALVLLVEMLVPPMLTQSRARIAYDKGNYYEAGTNFVFDKIVDGNAFLIGDKITINGKVNGDLYVMATDETLEKEGQIYGNVFVLADGQLKYSGEARSLLNQETLWRIYDCEFVSTSELPYKEYSIKPIDL